MGPAPLENTVIDERGAGPEPFPRRWRCHRVDQGVAGVVLRAEILTGEARGGLVEGAVVGQFDPSGGDGVLDELFDVG